MTIQTIQNQEALLTMLDTREHEHMVRTEEMKGSYEDLLRVQRGVTACYASRVPVVESLREQATAALETQSCAAQAQAKSRQERIAFLEAQLKKTTADTSSLQGRVERLHRDKKRLDEQVHALKLSAPAGKDVEARVQRLSLCLQEEQGRVVKFDAEHQRLLAQVSAVERGAERSIVIMMANTGGDRSEILLVLDT